MTASYMALYHKHRPQTFGQVIGQEHITQTLVNQVLGDKVAHAYLFSGPRGVGKTTLARILAKSLNCPNRKTKESEPCNHCSSCQEIAASRSIDVIEIDAASHTGVDNVRENIIENSQFKPTTSKYKVFIIDEVHMLSTSAFNALLKTLEEPPTHVIFILATTEAHKLLPTIVSRCQRFQFQRVPYAILKKHLEAVAKVEGVKIDKKVLERIIGKSEGCVRDAISLLDQIFAAGEKEITLEKAAFLLPTTDAETTLKFLTAFVERQPLAAIQTINQLVADGVNLSQFMIEIIELLRTLLVESISGETELVAPDLSEEARGQVRQLSKKISQSEIVKLTDLLLRRSGEIKKSPLPQLPLEMAAVEWAGNSISPEPEQSNHEDNNPPNLPWAEEKKTKKEDKKEEITLEIETTKTKFTDKVRQLVSKRQITEEEGQEKWPSFLDLVEKNFPSLSFILRMAEIKEIKDNVITVSVGFSFHRDKLMEKNCQKNLNNLLQQIFSENVLVTAIVESKEKETDTGRPVETDELQKIVSHLGGGITS